MVFLLFFLLGAALGCGFRVISVLASSALALVAVFVVSLVQSHGIISAGVDALLAVGALQAGYIVLAIGRGVIFPENAPWNAWHQQIRPPSKRDR